ncbi:hypothetical protein TYRP_022633 [Tyrophagus putrescentiae]|nr:hypothetical protein TYRP_022633 [Tyrophagus putrescentiae]
MIITRRSPITETDNSLTNNRKKLNSPHKSVLGEKISGVAGKLLEGGDQGAGYGRHEGENQNTVHVEAEGGQQELVRGEDELLFSLLITTTKMITPKISTSSTTDHLRVNGELKKGKQETSKGPADHRPGPAFPDKEPQTDEDEEPN